jgi:hypothetical protein
MRSNVERFQAFGYAVPHNNRHTLLLENISLYFILQQVFLLDFFGLYMPAYFIFYFGQFLIAYFHFSTWLYFFYYVFTKAVFSETSDWILVGYCTP